MGFMSGEFLATQELYEYYLFSYTFWPYGNVLSRVEKYNFLFRAIHEFVDSDVN